ncbi:MAG TPA: hypothetical protein VE224_02015, partial [Pseudolabrys sp.]|nr:hypothetical protein [Pseudolabrys sp.]
HQSAGGRYWRPVSVARRENAPVPVRTGAFVSPTVNTRQKSQHFAMSTESAKPSLILRAMGWITTPILYVVLIRIVISGIRRLPAHYR